MSLSSVPKLSDELLMARQPIFDRNSELMAYELLFRSTNELHANVLDGDSATSELLINLFTGISDFTRHLGKPLFVNFTSDLLQSGALSVIQPETVYFEILEGMNVTPGLIQAVQQLHEMGYHLILDDYHFDPTYDPILPFVSTIKIDVLATPPRENFKYIRQFKNMGYQLLAEKVETYHMYELCHLMGFDLFQGYYLARPELIRGRKVSSNMQFAVELVNALQDEEVSLDKVARLVARDPKLSYQLLKILNSPLCAIRRKVTSIKEAVVYLGLDQVRKWAFLVAMVSTTHQPLELFRILLTRAYSCETLGRAAGIPDSEAYFTAGLLSGIDAVVGADLTQTLHDIALDDSIVNAIVHFQGHIGERLHWVMALETNDWAYIQSLSMNEQRILSRSFGEGILWANGILESIR